MKELIKNLGFEHLPMLSEFVKALRTDGQGNRYYGTVNKYTDFITQPLTKEMFIPYNEDGYRLRKSCLRDYTTYLAWELNDKAYEEALINVLFECEEKRIETKLPTRQVWCNDILIITDKIGSDIIYHYDTIEQAINNGVKFKLK